MIMLKHLIACLVACTGVAASFAALSQTWPSRPIRSIMTVAGGADVVARLVAQGLTQALGQPVVVETQAGAGGAIGAETVARAAPDGHTIMLASASTMVMNRFLSKSAHLDALKDFTPITKAFETVALVISSPSLPVSSMQELIEYARRNPGKLSFGTSGAGTTHHLSGESIRLLTGIDWVHVPYKGGPPVLTDLLSGQIQVGFTILATTAPFLKSGKVRILAVNGAHRYAGIPDVPTISEQLPGYEATLDLGRLLRAGRNAAGDRRAPAPGDRSHPQFARGARQGRGHRLRREHQHARGAERNDTPRHRLHRAHRQGDRDPAGVGMAKKSPKEKRVAAATTRKPARRSPGKLRLTMMVGSYEIVRALKEGAVRPKGIDLVVADYPGTRDIHDKVARGEACDINEYNGGEYVVQKHRGRDDITALPVFLHRRFRHGFIYVNASGRREEARRTSSAAASPAARSARPRTTGCAASSRRIMACRTAASPG